MRITKPLFLFAFLVFTLNPASVPAQSGGQEPAPCAVQDRLCVIDLLRSAAEKIENASWRDQTYRELAKTLAAEGRTGDAIALIPHIGNPDTKAMTIRGIGMAAADRALPSSEYRALFTSLRAEAEKIDHPPSYAIALTYIAMAQAFAGDNTGAWKTASEMDNDALRHKAYGETAEIQAERGDFKAAITSISKINSASFRNKAYATVSKILADRALFEESFQTALHIENPYKQARALQYLLDRQKMEKEQIPAGGPQP